MDQISFTYLFDVLSISQKNKELLLPSRIRTRYQLKHAKHLDLVITMPATLNLSLAKAIIIGYIWHFNY